MRIKDLIPFRWRRRRQAAVPVPVTFDAPEPSTDRCLRVPGGLLGVHDAGIRVRTCNDSVEIEADLPGVAPEDVDLRIEDGQIVICGESRVHNANGQRSYRRVQRRLPLPVGVDCSKASAIQDNGVLTLSLPRRAPGGRIPVSAG